MNSKDRLPCAMKSLKTEEIMELIVPLDPTTTDLVKCYQDKKVPGDFSRFLQAQNKAQKNRVLQDTQGHVYFFKRTINKKNKFGKACRCGVWLCKQYRRLHCCCEVHTFGDTIVGSTGPHNHYPVSKDDSKKSGREDSRARREPLIVSRDFKMQVRRHNHGPKVESAKRSIERARDQLTNQRRKKQREMKKIVISDKLIKIINPPVVNMDEFVNTNTHMVDDNDSNIIPENNVPTSGDNVENMDFTTESMIKDQLQNICDLQNCIKTESLKQENIKKEQINIEIKCKSQLIVKEETVIQSNFKQETCADNSCMLQTKTEPLQKGIKGGYQIVEPFSILNSSETVSGANKDSLLTECFPKDVLQSEDLSVESNNEVPSTEPREDTLNEILEILNDLSKNSSHSYQMMCSQLLSEYLTGQSSPEATFPVKTISSFTVPIQEFPVSESVTSVHSSASIPPKSSSPVSKLISIAPKVTPITRAPQMRPFIKPSPPPNVTISYNKEHKSSVNPDMRPIINIPSLDTPSSVPQLDSVAPSIQTVITTSQTSQDITLPQNITSPQLVNLPLHASVRRSPELPPKSEFNILSDLTSLESLLDILKENSPIQDYSSMRCTCKTMLRCNLHDIGPGKKRQVDLRPRRVISRNDDIPKPARKKYCYRGSKKPYKFIPETFKDCQLPANEETVIGSVQKAAATGHGSGKRGRGGRRPRMVKPISLPSAEPISPVAPVPHMPSFLPANGVGLTPISPAPPPDARATTANTISLVPVTSMSTPSFENSKLLKAVPIGNGLYRLEEANEREMQGGALSKPVFTTDLAPNNGILTTGNLQLPVHSKNQRSKPLSVVEHHPNTTSPSFVSSPLEPLTSTSSQITSLLSSVISNMNAHNKPEIPLMIPASTSQMSGTAPLSTSMTSNSVNSALSSSLINQILDRLLSVESPDERILEALSSSNLTGITHH